MKWSRGLAATLVLAVVPFGLTGCMGRERVCNEGEYPVVEHSGQGKTCVKDGETPPPGYREYPAGNTPTYLDEDYVPTFTDTPDTPAPDIPVPDATPAPATPTS